MPPNAGVHPSPAQLTAFALGRLAEDESDPIAEHLAGCASCARQVAETPPDTFVSWLRSDRRTSAEVGPGGATGDYRPVEPSSVGPKGLPEQFGRYRILRKLGQGGMGSVYLAHDTQLDREVALKIPHFQPPVDRAVLDRFYREARAAAAFDHPNLCRVYDVGCLDGVPYLTMPFLEGRSLAEHIAGGKQLPPRQAAALIRKLALALQVAHDRGVIHRDLKPSNVLMKAGREPVIMDFGLARLDRSGDRHLTADGTLLGTPVYMAPEQVLGDQAAIGPAADVYALGVILYELLAGRLPFEGPATAVLVQTVADEPPPVEQLRPETGPVLAGIVAKMMAKAPAARYAGMADVAAVLADYLREGAAPAAAPAAAKPSIPPPLPPSRRTEARTPTPAPAPPRRRSPRRRVPWWKLAAAAGAAGLLLTLGIVLLFSSPNGTIRIEVSDPNAQVKVAVDRDEYTVTALGKPLLLKVGQHDLTVTGPDFETVTRKFTVRRGANPVYTVELIPKKGAAGATASGPPPPPPAGGPTKPRLPLPVQWGKEDNFVQVRTLTGHTGEVYAVAFSADGKRVITGSHDKTARVWDAETGDRLAELVGHTEVLAGVALSPDGKLALTGSADQTAGLWEVDSGQLLHQFKGHKGMVRATAFSPDGRLAASAGDDGIIHLYDVHKRTELRQLEGHADVVSSVAFGPDSDRLASGSWDRTVRLWDVAEGKQLKQYVGHTGWVQAVAYSPDGRRLLSGSGGAMKGNAYIGQPDCSARVWDVDSRKELLKLTDDWGGVCTVAFLPDSRHILFAEWRPFRGDRFLFLWDAETNREIARYQDPNSLSPTVAVATNGKQVVASRAFNAGPVVYVFDLPRQPKSK